MKEEFLHYIWKYQLFSNSALKTTHNKSVQIIKPGMHNHDSGPDFFNAKIKIEDTIWAGNVEIHINSSDWYKHNHQDDGAYNNVVLQVVYTHDKDITRANGETIPTVELCFDKKLLDNYETLIQQETWIPCEHDLNKVDSFTIQNWIEKLAVERLEEKSDRIYDLLKQTNNSWEEAFYIQLARNFGFKLNAEPFEQLTKSLPLTYLAKHKDNLFQIEALLFGQAGFLDENEGDEYFQKLKQEYLYLKKKFNLKGIERHLWKFLRSRPGNFATIRIAQFAQLIHRSAALFSKVLQTENVKEFYTLFYIVPSDYWENHYQFNKESVKKSKSLGKSAIDILLINTIIPFLFVYGKAKGLIDLQNRAIEFLEAIKPEKNSIITKWSNLGIKSASAFETQALIQLKNRYCNHKKCLNCQIGNSLIRKN
ncbi:MAG: DUF2851 family protein [Bacteroidetes bacterium]|nr:DUF2851 family protein [Bacteroidota bacterium]